MAVTQAVLRPMRADDLGAVLRIQREAYGDGYQESAAVLGAKLALAPQGCWLAEHGGEALAYVFAHPWHEAAPPPLHAPLMALPAATDTVFLHDLAVARAARGSGVAAGLCAKVEAWARRCGARSISLVALAAAVPYWRRNGYAAVAQTLPAGYGVGALPMRRALP